MRHRPADILPARPRDARRRLPPSEEARFRELYGRGATIQGLAAWFGLSYTTAWREARRLGLPRRYTTRAA